MLLVGRMLSVGRAVPGPPAFPAEREVIDEPVRYRARLCQALMQLEPGAVEDLAARILATVRAGNRILLAGNGGSASTASHYACDLTLTFQDHGLRPSIRNLAESMAVMTALANDYAYEAVFQRQVILEGGAGDLLVAISASGQSENILRAVDAAQDLRMSVVGLTGFDGGRLRQTADLSVHVHDTHYGVIEDVHLAVGHMVSQAVAAGLRRQGFVRDTAAE